MVNGVTWLCLAAGRGTRLRPITDEKPKAMVTVADKPLLGWLIDTTRYAEISKLAVVTGYLGTTIEDWVDDDVTIYRNPDYQTTDMVRSLWWGLDSIEGPVIISYSDILYTRSVLETVLQSQQDIVVAVDTAWRPYWETRHDYPAEDAEDLKLDGDRITSIGGNVDSVEQPEAQYIGLMKFSPEGVRMLRETYASMEQASRENDRGIGLERSFPELHMTDLLQGMIDRGIAVHGIRIHGDWVEIDTLRDLDIAREACQPTGHGTLEIDRSGYDDESKP